MGQDAFIPKKSLGQNFLVNPRIRQKIIGACDLKKDDVVLEIGPGKGMLTRPLAAGVSHVFAVEKDDYLARQLEIEFKGTNVSVIHADVLTYPFDTLPERLKVVGNLPYNIATPIIEKVLAHRRQFPVFYMTVQLEYGNRIVAQPHGKNYGSLSCFVQYYAAAKKLFKIPPGAFQPAPKVYSCFLSLTLRNDPEYPADDEALLFRLIRTAFNQRRKTLKNALGRIPAAGPIDEILRDLKINPMARAENISLRDYVRLANHLRGQGVTIR